MAHPLPFATLRWLINSEPNYYATLGLDRQCSADQIRAAYRILAKQHHPDVNPRARAASVRIRELNEAYETLSDPERRRAYDDSLKTRQKPAGSTRAAKSDRNISQDVQLRIMELIRGTTLEVRVNDPGNPQGRETYPLTIPPETAPGARFRVAREGTFAGGFVLVRVRVQPDFRFKARGSDLRCDLRISVQRATQGGTEMLLGPTGGQLRVQIPPRVARGEILRIPDEGLPKPRGGRGDLLVRITYRPEVRITRASAR